MENYLATGKLGVYFFCFIITLVSFLYSSVGHGGASGYLAVMSLFGVMPEKMRITALVLNLFVAGLSFYHFYKKGHFELRLFIPFAIGSVPMALVGGLFTVDAGVYKKILAIFLIVAVLKMLGFFGQQKNSGNTKEVNKMLALLIGAFIGFFSGLIGIGGGIILTPIVLLLYWGKAKEVAAVSALFIWVNSLSGIIGQLSIGVTVDFSIYAVLVFAIIGGFLGGYIGSSVLSNKGLKYVMASVLALATIKLLM